MPRGEEVIVGFPEFWPRVRNEFPTFFEHYVRELGPLQDEILSRSVAGPLPTVLRQIAKTVSNSLGAMLTLALNGFGHDAVRVARSMFEGAVVAQYLRKHPDKIDDYTDFYWVQAKSVYNFLVRIDPAVSRKISPDVKSEFSQRFNSVRRRFENRKGKLQERWSRTPLHQMAEEVKMVDLYDSFYRWASSIHHIDVTGLAAQFDEQSLDATVAPSFACVREALIMGHQTTLMCHAALNDEAGLGFESRLRQAEAAFLRIWRPVE